jgi:phage terminase small subunit
MPGRNAKSIGLHLAEGNPSHLTKGEIEARQTAEVKLGEKDLSKLKKPSFITKDKIAVKIWKELIQEYKSAAMQGIELLSSSDVGMLAMYCKTFSEYERLLVQYQRIENIIIDEHILDEYISHAEDVDEVNYKALRYLSQLASVEGILKMETAINKKMDMLLKMQDRLFLNPLAKVKNVPKPQETKKESAMSKFMKRKAGGGHGT